jgi:hypothetical protein
MSDDPDLNVVEGKFKPIKRIVRRDDDEEDEDEEEEDEEKSYLEEIFSNWDSETILEKIFGKIVKNRSEKRRDDRRRKSSRRHQVDSESDDYESDDE